MWLFKECLFRVEKIMYRISSGVKSLVKITNFILCHFHFSFLTAIKKYGVPDVDLFQTVDLYEKKDLAAVTTTLFALARESYKHSEFPGPHLGPKPAEENKRDFSEDVLKAGQTIIGLQAGTNKGASQAGQNIGASRKIILGK